MEGNSKLGRLLLKEKAKKNKETKYSARRGCHIKKEVGELKEGKHALEDGGRDSLIKGGKAQKSGKGAIATEFVQVCFLLLLEFLLIFDFSVCSFLNI